MVKKSIVERERKRRSLVASYGHKRSELRKAIKKKDISFDERLLLYRKLSSLKRDSSYVRSRNRCCLTGRARGYYRRFGLSRIKFREMASWGYIPGVVKFSW